MKWKLKPAKFKIPKKPEIRLIVDGKIIETTQEKTKAKPKRKKRVMPPSPDTIYRDTPQNFSFVL